MTLFAVALFTIVELRVRRVPLPRLAAQFGCSLETSSEVKSNLRFPLKELSPELAHRVVSARRVAKFWPFSIGPCLRRSLVCGYLLRELDPTIRIGLNEFAGSISAHAWVEIDGRPLEDVRAYAVFQTSLVSAPT